MTLINTDRVKVWRLSKQVRQQINGKAIAHFLRARPIKDAYFRGYYGHVGFGWFVFFDWS